MSYQFKNFVIGCMAVLAYQTAQAVDYTAQINNVYDLLNFQTKNRNLDDKGRASLVEQQMRLKLIEDYAKQSAMKAAIIATNRQINQLIKTGSRQLDAIYNFNALMIQGKVVPPVVSEAGDLYNQKGTNQLRLTRKVYKIEKQAAFSSTAPNWRSYLNFNYEADAFDTIAFMGGDLSPKNDTEMQVWKKATYEGWNIGVNEAGIALQQKLERLNRDYVGMIRFHTLALQGRISMPAISSYNLYDKNTGTQWVIDEKLLRIDTLPQFKQVGANEILSSYESDVIINQPSSLPANQNVAPNNGVFNNYLRSVPKEANNQSIITDVDSNNIVSPRPKDFNSNNMTIPPLNTIEINSGLQFTTPDKTAALSKPKVQQVPSSQPTYMLNGYMNPQLQSNNTAVIQKLPTLGQRASDANPKVVQTLQKIVNEEDIAPKPSLSPLDYVANPFDVKSDLTKPLNIQNTIRYNVTPQ